MAFENRVHVRQRLQQLLSKDNPTLQNNVELKNTSLFLLENVEMLLPVNIGA